jgi:hypothetical protein
VSPWLLRIYPPAWRERYGDELISLIEAGCDGGRISLRVKLDVIKAGILERLGTAGLVGDDGSPDRQARAGVLLVLSSWAAFVVAGLAFAKTSEHWQTVTPQPERGVAAAADDAVLLFAALGTLAVLLGIVLTARPLFAFLHAGGWPKIHRPVLRALAATGLIAVVLVGVVGWANQLTNGQRNGGDLLYSGAFLVLGFCSVAAVGLWAQAAVLTAGKLALSRPLLRRETMLAATTTVTMAVMTASETIWSASAGGVPAVRMVGMTFVMLTATTLAIAGTARSLHALRA